MLVGATSRHCAYPLVFYPSSPPKSTSMPPFAREPWSGDAKLVFGIDIGTTQTAVSYIHLYPGTYLSDFFKHMVNECSRMHTSRNQSIKLAWTTQ